MHSTLGTETALLPPALTATGRNVAPACLQRELAPLQVSPRFDAVPLGYETTWFTPLPLAPFGQHSGSPKGRPTSSVLQSAAAVGTGQATPTAEQTPETGALQGPQDQVVPESVSTPSSDREADALTATLLAGNPPANVAKDANPAEQDDGTSHTPPGPPPGRGPRPRPRPPRIRAADPLWVLDANDAIVLTPGVVEHECSTWSMDLRAQVSGGTVATYTFNTSGAPDAENITQQGYKLTFNWRSVTQGTPAYRVNTIVVSTTNVVGDPPPAQTLTFHVYGTNSPGCTSPDPTTVNTWLPSTPVVTPDKVMSDEEVVASQYYSVSLLTGEARHVHTLPTYNPGVPPLGLVYAPPQSDSRPIFLDRFTLDPTRATAPPRVSAKLTLNGVAGSEIFYDTALLNPGGILHIALQATTAQMNTITSTGRYSWQIDLTAHYTPTVPTTHSGQVTILHTSGNAFGAGWSLDILQRLWPLNAGADGAILELAGGRSLWFAPNGTGGFVRPAGDFSTLEKIASNYRRTLKDGTQINFDSAGKQTSIVDCNNNTLTFAYGGNGRLATMTDVNNRVTQFGYNDASDTKVRTITDPANRVTTLSYNGTSTRLLSLTDPDPDTAGTGEPAPVTAFTYDSTSARLKTVTSPRNHVTTLTYDFADRVSQVSRPDTSVQQFTPLLKRGLAAVGQGTSYNNPTKGWLAVEAEAVYKDPRNYEWPGRLDWLGFGRTMQAVTPLTHMAVTHRDANGLVWLGADRFGRRTRHEFDASGNVTKRTFPDEAFETFVYNTYSRLTQYTDPRGKITTYGYDPVTLVNLVSLTPPGVPLQGEYQSCALPCVQFRFVYTAHGFLSTMTDVGNRTTGFTYDSWDRLTQITYPDEDFDPSNDPKVFLQYNNASDLTQRTDELGKVTVYDPDNLGRLRKTILPDEDSDPNNNPTITMTYDTASNRLSLTDPRANTTWFTYEQMNRLESKTDPFNKFDYFHYDLGGNLDFILDRNNRERYFLTDEAGRRTLEQWYNGETLVRSLNFAYNAANELTQADDPDSKYVYLYHSRGWVAEVDNNGTPGVPRVALGSGYDLNGNRTSLTDNLNGLITSTYDDRNRMTETTLTVSATVRARAELLWDQLDRLFQVKRREVADTPRVTSDLTYDARDRLDGLSHTSTVTGLLSSMVYGYDLASRLQTYTGSEGTLNYTHDPIGQLKTVTGARTENYTYDSNGNRTMA